jgi:hypothetical protein
MAAAVTFRRLLILPRAARGFGVQVAPDGEKVTHTGQVMAAPARAAWLGAGLWSGLAESGRQRCRRCGGRAVHATVECLPLGTVQCSYQSFPSVFNAREITRGLSCTPKRNGLQCNGGQKMGRGPIS